MKEFQTKKGGRVLYNEDFYNLQEINNSNAAFFSSLGINFVISGCTKDSDGYVEGYVMLNGKVRKVEKTKVSDMISPAIIVNDTTYTDQYEDGNVSPTIYDYGCKIIDLSKTSTTQNKIVWNSSTGFGNIYDSFIGNLVVLKDSSNSQSVQGSVKFNGAVELTNAVISKSGINLTATQLSDGSIQVGTMCIHTDGSVSFSSGSSYFALDSQDNDAKLQMTKASVCQLKAKVLKATSFNNSSFADKLSDIQNITKTTDWYNIIDASNSAKVSNLRCKIYNGVAYIQGTLPVDFCNKSKLTSYQSYMVSDYALPDGFPLPTADVEFDVMSPNTSGMAVTVRIMRSGAYTGRFYFDSDAFPADDSSTTIQNKYGLSYPYPPSVAWQYMANADYSNSYDVSTSEEFVCYSYNYGSITFIAWNKITLTLTNKKTGETTKQVMWTEAEFVGSVHQGDNPGNYCSTSKSANSDGSYGTECASGTLYFRSLLDSSKLYSQTCFYSNSAILNGTSVSIYDFYIDIVKPTGTTRVVSNGSYTFSPTKDVLTVHSVKNAIAVATGESTDSLPSKYMVPQPTYVGSSFSTLSGSAKYSKSTSGVNEIYTLQFSGTVKIRIQGVNSNYVDFYLTNG